MYDTKEKVLTQIKSHTSIYEIFRATPFSNAFYRWPNKYQQKQFVYITKYSDTMKKSPVLLHSTQYVTSEKYHCLNKNSSIKTVVPSTSTIFYDLDDIAKRHSFHCLARISVSNVNTLKTTKLPVNTNEFERKSEAIIQECITQVKPIFMPRDSIEINIKKEKYENIRNIILSPEIFLKDEKNENKCYQSHNHTENIVDKEQKLWSYSKHYTDCTNSVIEQKRIKKKDRGKRTEDPCPCQLFLYACPCTAQKSLTELAKHSKPLTVTDQITSTTKVVLTEKVNEKVNKQRKQKHNNIYEDDKTTNTYINLKQNVTDSDKETIIQVTDKHDLPTMTEIKKEIRESKINSQKRQRKLICPHCKEKVDVISSTEEEDKLKNEILKCRSKDILATATYAYRASPRNIINETLGSTDVCPHEPPCELVPICQMLPSEDNNYCNKKTSKPRSYPKSSPRVIRITKACRHHPPCTVVPSCQRVNVLKNNCEYVPPCLHQPRCVNLPLCIPISRDLDIDDTLCNHIQNDRNTRCPYVPRCKYIPVCQHESLTNHMEERIEIIPEKQNAYEFTNGYQTPTFLANPKANSMLNSISPFHITSPYACSCRSNKSCQYNFSNKFHSGRGLKENNSNETIVFIRDVGCQFRSKNNSPKDSLINANTSSGSFDYVGAKMGNYYTNVHTLRYEDKFTSPLSEAQASESSFSVSTSMEIDARCPSHGHKRPRKSRRNGLNPETAYVTAYSTRKPQLPTNSITSKKKKKSKLDVSARREFYNPLSVKSRRSFLKGKYSNKYTQKRIKKSCTNKYISDYSTTTNTVFANSCESNYL